MHDTDAILYGKKPVYSGITPINDINLQILQHRDINSLIQYCMINEYALQYCNNPNLCKNKLRYKFIKNYPKTTMGWIKLYKKLEAAYEKAKTLLIVRDMGDNEVGIWIEKNPHLIDEIASHYVKELLPVKAYKYIEIESEDDGSVYYVSFGNLDEATDYDWTKEQVIELLTFAFYVKDKTLVIADDNNIPYLIDDNTIDAIDHRLYYDHNQVYTFRQTILKTIHYMKSKNYVNYNLICNLTY